MLLFTIIQFDRTPLRYNKKKKVISNKIYGPTVCQKTCFFYKQCFDCDIAVKHILKKVFIGNEQWYFFQKNV